MIATKRLSRRQRSGTILVMAGLLMVLLLGMVALAVDIGLIMFTRTQLQSASDSGSLAGGTELLPGLGVSAYRTPAQVKTSAETQAVNFVAMHRAGEASAANIQPSRDVKMGTAKLNVATGAWSFNWGATPYNAVGVTTLRSSVGSTPGDRQLPLVFAPVLGQTHADITVDSVAVILPAKGIHIDPGETITSGLTPFAFLEKRWKQYWAAVAYFKANGIPAYSVDGPNYTDEDGVTSPLFYEMVQQGNQLVPRQLFADDFGVAPPSTTVTPGGDGILEMNIYPISSTSGNLGTVDIGGNNNSTADLVRQILHGVSAADLAHFPDSTFNPGADVPGGSGEVVEIDVNGDTGISSGIKSALESIIGHPRSMVLYSTVANPGNNATYRLVDMVGIRFMDIKLTGNPKTVIVQPASVSDPAGIPDHDEDIGTETTFFTPLILAK